MDAATSSRPLFKRYWPILKAIIFVIVLTFIAKRAYQLWFETPHEAVHINGLWLIPAGLAYFAGWLPSAWFWQRLLISMHQPLNTWDTLRAYYIGHLGKYVPGKALVLVLRGSLVKDAGVNPVLAGMTAAYETLVFMATGAALAVALAPIAFGESIWTRLPTGLLWFKQHPFIAIVIVLAITMASTPVTAWLFTGIVRRAMLRGLADGRLPLSISAGLLSQGTIATAIGWMFHALSLGFVLQSVSDHPFDLTAFPVWLAACTGLYAPV